VRFEEKTLTKATIWSLLIGQFDLNLSPIHFKYKRYIYYLKLLSTYLILVNPDLVDSKNVENKKVESTKWGWGVGHASEGEGVENLPLRKLSFSTFLPIDICTIFVFDVLIFNIFTFQHFCYRLYEGGIKWAARVGSRTFLLLSWLGSTILSVFWTFYETLCLI
jgi:hypothetical protein